MARKLEAGLAGRYLISRVLMTSTMKSEPGTPPIRGSSFGAAVSATATCMVGGNAEGRRGALMDPSVVAAFATGGASAVVAPATAAPAQEFAPTHLGTRLFSCHGVSPLNVMRSALRLAPARSSSWGDLIVAATR